METAILITQAIEVAILLVGGFYLRYFITQQLAAKDATIENLRDNIRTLERQRAPQLAGEIEKLATFSDGLQGQLAKLQAENGELREKADKAGIDPAKLQREGFLQGFSMAVSGVRAAVSAISKQVEKSPLFTSGMALETLLKTMENVNAEVALRFAERDWKLKLTS